MTSAAVGADPETSDGASRRGPGRCLRLAALALFALAACAQPTPPGSAPAPAAAPATASAPAPEPDFDTWRAARAADVAALHEHLAQAGVAAVLPLPQLLRSASSWRDCGAEPWALPPAAQWPEVVSVLRLLQAVQAAGVLGPVTVHSGYRDEALNRCAGGAPGSAHRTRFALDLTPSDGRDPGGALCDFWRREGPAWRMGLGRYASGRIHLDTAGHRRWGSAGAPTPCAEP